MEEVGAHLLSQGPDMLATITSMDAGLTVNLNLNATITSGLGRMDSPSKRHQKEEHSNIETVDARQK